MKKDSFEKKLAAYIAMSSAFLAVHSNANAQIIYTDVNPDFVSSNGSYYLDLNNDGIVDFNLNASMSASYSYYPGQFWSSHYEISLSIQGIGYNKVKNDLLQFPLALNAGDTIIPSISQLGNGQILYHHQHSELFSIGPFGTNVSYSFDSIAGNWTNQNDRYLGLKINVGGNNYYGWARLVIDGYQVTLKDYACFIFPDYPIIAGETSCNFYQPTLLSSPLDSICVGEIVTLQILNYQGDTIHWYRNGILLPLYSSHISVNQSGTYYAEIIYNYCPSETSNTISITNVGTPNIPIINLQNDSLFTIESPVFHYQWFYGTYPIPNSDNYFFVPQWTGFYKVKVTNQNNCSRTSPVFNYVLTNANPASYLSDILIFTIEQNHLQLISLPEQLVRGEIKIFDIKGKLLIEQKLMNSSEQIPLTNFSSGIYFFEIRKDELVVRKKFFVN